jgi:glycogen operon protein
MRRPPATVSIEQGCPDPYAKSVARPIQWGDEMFGYTVYHGDEDLFVDRHNAALAPLAAVVDSGFTWATIGACTPWHNTVNTNAHARVLEAPPDISERLRGT